MRMLICYFTTYMSAPTAAVPNATSATIAQGLPHDRGEAWEYEYESMADYQLT